MTRPLMSSSKSSGLDNCPIYSNLTIIVIAINKTEITGDKYSYVFDHIKYLSFD